MRSGFKKSFAVGLLIALLMGQAPMVYAASGSNNREVIITQEGVELDSFMGVGALYRPGLSDGTNTTYSCAAYVKRYYQAVYGVIPYNLLHKQTPTVDGDSFVRVSVPKIGDICAEIGTSSNHWSIVRTVNKEKVIVVEQNYKWKSGTNYIARVNREVPIATAQFFRLASKNTEGEESSSSSPVVSTPKDNVIIDVNTPDIVQSSNSKADTCKVSLEVGKSTSLSSKQFSTLSQKQKVKWVSSNKNIATVSSQGKIKAIKLGHADITGNVDGQAAMICSLTVTKKTPASVLTLSHKDVTLRIDKKESFQLKAARKPVKSSDKVTFTSSKKKVAAVSDEGIVQAKGKGTATVTVKTKSGLTATCIVRVR